MTLKELFGSNVRQYRKSKKLTQAELAEKTDLSLDMISRIERGVTGPSFNTIETLSKILEVQEITLFSSGSLTVPQGERGRLLQRINLHLSKMNESELAIAANMLKALKS